MRQFLEQQLSQMKHDIEQVDWANKNVYGDYLAQTYYFVCHSTRLLALAASRFPVSEDQMFQRFTQHLGEEKNHEKIALTDLKNLSLDVTDFPERAQTRTFYESQYYKIEFQDPTALLGYILFLEALAVQGGPAVHKFVSEHFGPKVCNFLRIHVEEDPDHVDKALQMLNHFDERRLKFIAINLQQSAEIFTLLLQSLGKDVGTKAGGHGKKAA